MLVKGVYTNYYGIELIEDNGSYRINTAQHGEPPKRSENIRDLNIAFLLFDLKLSDFTKVPTTNPDKN